MNYFYRFSSIGNFISLKISMIFILVFTYSFTVNAQINSFPHIEDWESQSTCSTSSSSCGTVVCSLTNGWINAPTGDDNFDWRVDAGGTPSSSTGPGGSTTGQVDHNPGTTAGKYLYMESSCTGSGNIADLISPSIDLTSVSNLRMDLWYHMYGATMGTMQIDVSTDGGLSWLNIEAPWTDNLDLWQMKTIILDAYAGMTINIRIRGISGTSFTSDMAIDDMTFYELSNNDAGLVSIDSPTSPSTPGVNNVSVTITNYGIATLTSATINWSVDGVVQTPFSWTGSVAQGATDGPVTIGSYNFTAGTHDIAAWTSSPNGGTDGDHSNDSTFANGVVFCPPLSGNYTIDQNSPVSATNYNSFQAIANDLSSCGVSGAVTIDVVAASGPYIEQFYLNTIPYASSTNTVTFNGNGETITFSSSDGNNRAVIRLDGADYVTINNFIINAIGPNTYGWGIHLINGADNNTISNNTVYADTSTTTSSTSHNGIVASASLTSATSSGDNANNLTISNNNIIGGYYGVVLYGTSSTILNIGNQILDNSILQSDEYGIRLYYQDAPIVSGNTVILPPDGSYGLYTFNMDGAFQITNNKFYNWETYGIYLSGSNNTAISRALIANNMISSEPVDGTYGIYLTNADNIDIWFNSIRNEDGDGLYVSSSTSENLDIRNNSFMYAGAGADYAMYVSSTSSIIVSDYNNYYSTGTSFVYYGGAMTDLAALQVGGNDLNSKAGDPGYIAIDNLHSIGIQLDNSATPIAGITTDIDGQPRDLTTPDIGADEYTPPPYDVGPTALVAPATSGCLPPSSDIIVEVTNFGQDPINFSTNNLTVSANITGPLNQVISTTLNTGTLNVGATINVNLGTANLSTTGSYNFDINTSMPGDAIVVNNNLNIIVSNLSITVFPYVEDLETGGTVGFPSIFPNGWTADLYATASTGFGFALDFGGTGSSSTGPEYDHTNFGVTDGGNYAYLETSSGSTGNEAMFISPCVDFTSLTAPAISFWYHMYGATIGELHMDVSSDNGATWDLDVMTPIIGQQQTDDLDPWLQKTVFLDAYSGQRVLIRFRGVRGGGITGDLAIDDINIYQQPPCDPNTLTAGTATISDDESCAGDSVLVSIDGNSTGAGLTIQWYSSTDGTTYSAIPGATTNNYQSGPLSGGTYSYFATVNCSPNSSNSDTVSVTINDPQILSTLGDTICGTGEVTLSATANEGTMYWYSDINSNTPVDTGNTFTTTITETTTFYAAASTGGGTTSVGAPDPSMGTISSYGTDFYYMEFDVIAPVTIASVDVYPTASVGSTSSIEIHDNSGSVLYNIPYTTTVTGGNQQTIALNVTLAPGTGYRMHQGSNYIDLNRNTSGASYPYTSSALNITGNNFSTSYYYWFYNWQLATGCSSDKVAVTAVSTPAPPVEIAGSSTICEGSSTSLTINIGVADYTNFNWSPSDGLSDTTGASVNASPTTTTTYVVFASGNVNNCQTTDTFTLNVINVELEITADNPLACGSTPTQVSVNVNSQNLPSANFANSDTIFIPASGTGSTTGSPASPYPSVINVSGLPVNALFKSISLKGLNHTFADDIDIALVSPANEVVILMSDIGSGFDLSGETYTFSIDATSELSDVSAGNPSGIYLPSNSGINDDFPAPGPGDDYDQANPSLSSFAGNPNGTWSLYVVDDGSGDIGYISDGWELEFIDPSSFTYNWSPSTGLSSTSISNPTALPPTPGTNITYTVVATEGVTGCSSSSSITIYREDPLVTASAGDTICGYGDVTLTASANTGNIYWWDQPSGGQLLQVGTSYEPFITETTTYHASAVTSAAPAQLTSTFEDGLILATGQSGGNMFDITAINPVMINTFDIHLNNAAGTLADVEIYYKEGSFSGFQSDPSAWTLLQHVTGVSSAGPGNPSSLGVSLDIVLQAGSTYAFFITTTNGTEISYTTGDLDETDDNIALNFGSAVAYPIGSGSVFTTRSWNGTVHYSLVCESPRIPVTAVSTPAPVVDVTGGGDLCGNETATLTVTTGASDYTNFEWSPAIGLSSTTGTSVIASPTQNTTYVVFASGNINGCQITDTIDINVIPPPPLALTASGTFFCDVANATLSAGAGGSPSVQIGTGTSTSSSYPIYISSATSTFKYSKSTQIFTAAEIIAAGGAAGLINQISYEKADADGYTNGDATLNIYLKHVSNSQFSTTSVDWATEVAGATLVYSSSTQNLMTATGWQDFVLTTPFTWNGADNVQVLVDWFRPGNATGSVLWRYTSGVTNASAYDGDSSPNTTMSRVNNRPNIQFGFAQSLSYAWSPSIGLSSVVGPTVTATPSVSTTYNVVVTDNLTGCQSTDSIRIEVEAVPTPVITSSVANPVCQGQLAVLGTQYSSADGFQFNWNSGLAATETMTASIPGNYTLIVTSPNGCSSNLVTYTVEFASIYADIGGTTDVLCNGDSTGTVTINALGTLYDPSGNVTFGPFAYSANGGAFQGSATLTGLWAGNHNIAVYDSASGCTANVVAVVSEPSPLVAGPVVINQNVSCNGGEDGSANVSASGGIGPYTFNWNTPIPKQGEVHDEIPAGTWIITVTDANGCTATTTVTITEPDPLAVSFNVTDATYWNAFNGSVEAVVSGGTIPYTYLWSTGATTSSIGQLHADAYTLTITDANGCMLTETVLVNEPPFDCIDGTQTHFIQGPGGWGGQPSGNNPATYLYANFAAGFPNGLTIGHPAGTPGGCNRSITLTSEQAVTDFLPSAGQPRRLDPGHQVDITASQYGNILASMAVALTLEVVFDTLDPNFSPSSVAIGEMIYIGGGQYNGMTVYQILDAANNILACGGPKNQISQLNTVIDNILHQSSVLGCPSNPVIRENSQLNTIVEDDEFKVNIYPNPTSGIVNVSFESDNIKAVFITVMDLRGRELLRIQLDGSINFTEELNLSSFENGLYFINIVSEQTLISTSRVVKTQ